jgi:hypothetical protein
VLKIEKNINRATDPESGGRLLLCHGHEDIEMNDKWLLGFVRPPAFSAAGKIRSWTDNRVNRIEPPYRTNLEVALEGAKDMAKGAKEIANELKEKAQDKIEEVNKETKQNR